MTRLGLSKLLSLPILYSAFQSAVGARGARVSFVSEHLRPEPGERILDIGCGTGEIIELLTAQKYVGFDPSEPYIDAARVRFGKFGSFWVGSVDDPPVLDGEFDAVIAVGVLHHLDDSEARRMVDLARAQLRRDGRLVTLDPVLVPGQNPIARTLAKRDRGGFVRSPSGYAGLVAGRFESVKTAEHHDYLRVPYSHFAMECV